MSEVLQKHTSSEALILEFQNIKMLQDKFIKDEEETRVSK